MKRFLIICLAAAMLLLVSGSALAGDMLITKIGLNTNGYINFIPENPPGTPLDEPVYSGCVISVEQLFELTNRLEVGYGTEIQFGGSLNIFEYFRGIPVFFSLYYHPDGVDEPGYYFLGRIGFNLNGYYGIDYYYSYYNFRDPMINGFYCAAGAGIRLSEYPVIRLEAFFSGNNGTTHYYASPSDYSAYTRYTKFTIVIGFGVGN
jgi:hypothetical protein